MHLSASAGLGPVGGYDLSDPSHVRAAYQAAINECRTVDLERVLNAAVLVAVWPQLRLPHRARALWEARLPELAAARRLRHRGRSFGRHHRGCGVR